MADLQRAHEEIERLEVIVLRHKRLSAQHAAGVARLHEANARLQRANAQCRDRVARLESYLERIQRLSESAQHGNIVIFDLTKEALRGR